MILSNRAVLFFFLVILFSSCFFPGKKDAGNPDTVRESLIKADHEFSQLSAAKGLKNAFLEFIDSNGVLLRPNFIPLAGADAVDYLLSTNDTGYVMTWQPKQAEAAASGDLGYTYGTYTIVSRSPDTTLYGTYVSIWKKNAAGKWKFVLDSGNEGIGDPQPGE